MEACKKWKESVQAQNPEELRFFIYKNQLESIR